VEQVGDTSLGSAWRVVLHLMLHRLRYNQAYAAVKDKCV
jgi:hypothetical protein